MHAALSMIVHGPSGAGKSLLGSSTPWPRLLLDAESAARFLPLKAVKWDPANPPPPSPKITNGEPEWDTCVVTVHRWADVLASLDWLKQGDHPFRSVTVDSISELQYRYIEHVAGRDTMKIQDWGAALREVGGFARDMRDLTEHPTNPLSAVVFTAMTKEDNQGIMRPYLQGQLGAQIPYLFDVCAWLYAEADADGIETRWLQTRRMNGKEAKERVGGRIPPLIKLPQVTGDTEAEIRAKNVTFEKLIKMVFKGKGISQPAQIGIPSNQGQTQDGPQQESVDTADTPATSKKAPAKAAAAATTEGN
jgi:AAA domain